MKNAQLKSPATHEVIHLETDSKAVVCGEEKLFDKLKRITDLKVSAYGREILQTESEDNLRSELHLSDGENFYDAGFHQWRTYGNPTITDGFVLNVNSAAQLYTYDKIVFGGADFTIEFWAYVNSDTPSYSTIFAVHSDDTDTNKGQITLEAAGGDILRLIIKNSAGSEVLSALKTVGSILNKLRHYTLVYTQANSTIKIFVDGALKDTRTVSIERLARRVILGGFRRSTRAMLGAIANVRISDMARYTGNFTPPSTTENLLDDNVISYLIL